MYENNGALFINDKILEQVVINSKKDSKKFTLYFGANRSAGISKFFASFFRRFIKRVLLASKTQYIKQFNIVILLTSNTI